MKKLIVTSLAVVSAATVFAQGTIVFNNLEASTRFRIFAPLPGAPGTIQTGNASTDAPAGTTVWTGYTVIGASASGQYGASATMAELLAGAGLNVPESSLLPATAGGITTFKTGGGAGYVAGTTPTFGNLTPDSAGGATVDMVVWDDSSGQYATWAQASVAWQAGLIAAADSGPHNLTAALGGTGTPPNLPNTFTSFNLYFIPEPTSFALAGLGAAALLIFRRRK